MIPESHENRDIRLYKCEEFYKWKLEKILMSDVSAVDTIVVKNDQTWFMLLIFVALNLLIILPYILFR